MTANDTEVIIKALRKEREQAHQRVSQLDRIIKQVKDGIFPNDNDSLELKEDSIKQPVVFSQSFKSADMKVQILRVLDGIGKAVKLQIIQDEYNRLSEPRYEIRDTVRSLQNSLKLKMIKEKGATRGFLWAKAEWIDNGQLLEQYKPEGFDI